MCNRESESGTLLSEMLSVGGLSLNGLKWDSHLHGFVDGKARNFSGRSAVSKSDQPTDDCKVTFLLCLAVPQ